MSQSAQRFGDSKGVDRPLPASLRPGEQDRPAACPYNYLYWRFIDEHAGRLAGNPRMRTVVNAWLARSEANKEPVRESARALLTEHVPV